MILSCVAISLVLSITGAPDTPSPGTVVAGGDLRAIADSLRRCGQYDSAVVYYGLAIPEAEQAAAWPELVGSLTAVAAALTEAGKPAQALPYAQRAVEVGIREIGGETEMVALAKYVNAYALTLEGHLNEAKPLFDQCLGTLRALLPADDLKLAEPLEGYAEYFSDLGDFDRQISLLEQVLAIRQHHPDEEVAALAITYSNLGLAYQAKGQYRRATGYLLRAVEQQVKYVGEHHPFTATMYSNLGMCYFSEGDNDRAIENYQKSLAIHEAIGGGSPMAAYAHNNIAMTYRVNGDFERALDHGRKALVLQTKFLGPDHPNVAIAMHNLGRTYYDMGEYGKAEDNYRMAQAKWIAALGPGHTYVGGSYFSLSNLALKKRQLRRARRFVDSCLTIQRESLGEHHPKVAEALRTRGMILEAQGYTDSALKDYQSALMILAEGFTGANVRDNPPETTEPRVILLETLASKAGALVKRSRRLDDLDAAAHTCTLAAGLIDRLRRGYASEGAKLYLTSRSFGVLEQGIRVVEELFRRTHNPRYNEMAFGFAEQGKAGMMAEALAEADARSFAGIPDTLLEREQSLREEITYLGTRLQKMSGEMQREAVQVREMENRLFAARRAYERWIATCEEQFPRYYDLKHRPERIALRTLMASLDADEALLEYVVADTSVHILAVTQRGLTVFRSHHGGALEQDIVSFRDALRNADTREYCRSASALYRLLVAPVAREIRKHTRLTIVPDGPLHYLPFEALLTHEVDERTADFRSLPYVLSEHEISYAMSATLRGAAHRTPTSCSGGFAGIAPVFDEQPTPSRTQAEPEGYVATTRSIRLDGVTYPALPESEKEVVECGKLFREKGLHAGLYLRSKAVKSALIRVGDERVSCLHIASHGFIDEIYPKLSGILFAREGTPADAVLYTSEVYNLALNADLVTLSACESGLGKVVRGEGMLGLTRGFLYAGAGNVMVSLWQVADRSTADLMVEFYRNVLAGQSFATALRNAKLTLIRQGTNAFPLEWAPFVLVGW